MVTHRGYQPIATHLQPTSNPWPFLWVWVFEGMVWVRTLGKPGVNPMPFTIHAMRSNGPLHQVELFNLEFKISFRFTFAKRISCTSAFKRIGMFCRTTWLLDVNSLAQNLGLSIYKLSDESVSTLTINFWNKLEVKSKSCDVIQYL